MYCFILKEDHARTTIADQGKAKGTERLKAATTQAATPRMQDDLEITDLSAKCSELAEGLLAELHKLRLERSGLRQALKKSFRAITRKASLKEKQELLEKYQRVLDTRILMRLDTRSLKEMQNFQNLDQNVKELFLALEQGRNTVAQLLAGHSQTIKDHIDEKFESHTQQTAKSLAHERLLESLFFPEILSRQEQIPEEFEGTSRWIFDPPTDKQRWSNFRDWLEAGDDIYWISGKPGSGKSTLMKYIVSEELTSKLLDNWRKDNEMLKISFFFWNAGTSLQKSVTGLLRSLLYQVAIHWPDLVKLAGSASGNATGAVTISKTLHHLAEWTDQRLLSALRRFLDQKPTSLSICAFVDGLDEFVGDEELLLDIVRLFGNASQCKVCVSSRPEQAFRQEFRLCSQLRVQDLNRKDIEWTVTGRLSPHLKKYIITDEERKSLESELVWKAQGVFLWLDLMIKTLIKGSRNGDSYKELRLRLERTPGTIDGMYMHILPSLDPSYQEEGSKYFSVLLAAGDLSIRVRLLDLVIAEGEPWEHVTQFDLDYFTAPQLDSACRHMETRIIACCGALVEIQEIEDDWDDVDLKNENLEVERSENENSGNEYSEIENSREKNYEAVDSENRNTITYYNPKLDFTHRTAMEYIGRQQEVSSPGFSDIEAQLRLARGVIGRLVLSYLTHPLVDMYTNTDLAPLISEIVMFTSATGYSRDTLSYDKALESDLIDLTSQLFQSLQKLYTLIHHSEQDVFTETAFLQHIVKENTYAAIEDHQLLSWCQISDRLSGAAFFGFYHYVEYQLSMHSIADERTLNLPQAVTSGFEHMICLVYNSDCTTFPRLLAIQSIQQRYRDPNKQYIVSPYAWRLILYATHWGATCALIVCVLYWERSRLSMWSCVNDLVETFLSLGANPNTRIVLTYWTYNYDIIMEQSPLALVEYVPGADPSLLSVIRARLCSAGAVNHRRFLFISNRIGVANKCFYRLSHLQSERLIGAMRSSWSKRYSAWGPFLGPVPRCLDESDERMFEEIENSFTEKDSLDEQTVLDEIKKSEESF